MPRTYRDWTPDAILGIGTRAHCGAPILAAEEDRAFLVDRAARVFREEGVTCLAWAILINHYHMLARFAAPPHRAMQRLNTALALRVRRLAGGEGAVFQDRYFGRQRRDTASVLNGLAYVTANPIHHGVVPTVELLRDYEWSSLGEVLGRRPAKLADPAAALALLDAPPGRGGDALIELLEVRVRMWARDDAASPMRRHPDEDAPLDPEPATEGDIVATARPDAATPWELAAERRAILRARGWTPDALIAAACSVTGADPRAVRSGARPHTASRARAIVLHLACDHLAWPPLAAARCVAISPSSAVAARARGAAILAAAGVGAADVLRRAGCGG